MRIILAFFLLILLLSGCTANVPKSKLGQTYYNNINKVLSRNYPFKPEYPDSTILIILHSDTLCSCNGKNLFLVNEILYKRKHIRSYIFVKNDYKKFIRNQLYLTNSRIFLDTTDLLEKNGCFFRFDKIFALVNGKYDNMFDLEEKDIENIKRYYSLN